MKKQCQKKIAVVAAICLVFASLVACGKKEEPIIDPVPEVPAKVEESAEPMTYAGAGVGETVNLEEDTAMSEPISRREVLEYLYKSVGSPKMLSEFPDRSFIEYVDMSAGDADMMAWYQLALTGMDTKQDENGNCTFLPDEPATRFFTSSLIWLDMCNRGYVLDEALTMKVSDINGPDDIPNGILYLCQSGVVPDVSDGGSFDPAAAVTKASAEEFWSGYDKLLKGNGLDGDISLDNQVAVVKATTGVDLVADRPQVATTSEGVETTTASPAGGSGGVTTDAPGLAAYGLTSFVGEGSACSYHTTCNRDKSKTTNGTVTFYDYSRTDAGDGYEKVAVTMSVVLADENVQNYGYDIPCSITDVYHYSEGGKDADLLDGKHSKYSIVWNGETYDKCGVDGSMDKEKWTNSNTTMTLTFHFTAKVPKGYDGIAVWTAAYPGTDDYTHLSKMDGLLMFRCN